MKLVRWILAGIGAAFAIAVVYRLFEGRNDEATWFAGDEVGRAA